PGRRSGVSAEDQREAVKHLFHLYNAQGLTSVADRNASRANLDLYLALRERQELTVRVNVARSFDPDGSREEVVRRLEALPGKDLRFCITHANFPSQENLERCRRLGVCADVQPAWLYKDGSTLARVLDEKRMRWFQPYKSWLDYTTIGGGSDHMIKLDSLEAT